MRRMRAQPRGACVLPLQGSLREGRVWFREGLLHGFMDAEATVVVPPRYEYVDSYREGRAWVRHGGRDGFIDLDGREVVPCVYEAVGPFAGARAAVQDAGLWGYVDPTGRRAVPCQFLGAEAFLRGNARVVGPCGVGLVDPEGRMVVPCAWLDVSQRVGDGRVRVAQGSLREADEVYACNGYVDLTGRVVIACHYELADDFEGGRARVTTRAPGGVLRSFYIDPDGRELSPP